ncbi:cupin domain-containing protein [Amycolatopsis sp. EV170708-02-1]|uniref:cupin domain-containing protein n=1 Tax=Amycolatopsis sp. EV170708-02-1 TaxID=2919322 RepID=UPI001F0CA4CF|nr:cupin domain-containing protein [Amycolatopsis sp. EV170708-02-1]UMP06950.1 cupin domain-containing protein [Amycolatopsis sp. EV170708-02-1]
MIEPITHPVATHALARKVGPQGQLLSTAISSDICGSRTLGVGYVSMNALHYTRAHRHCASDIVVTVIAGVAATIYGDDLQHTAIHSPGDSIFIPAGVPHAAINLSNEVVHAVEIRTDPHFADSDVELLPDLEPAVRSIAGRIQAQHQPVLEDSRSGA